jgi:anion-transporting  ArsA/GET3 family ATPase
VLLTGKVKEAVTRTDETGRRVYDAVVLDAPPTGRITKFLNATTEVANLTKFGPINRQSEGVMRLLRSKQTAVHIVTLLEEMPVQETLDAAAELRASGFPLGVVFVNRARPVLFDGRRVEVAAVAAGLRDVRLPVALAEPLSEEVAEYADRLDIESLNETRLDELELPRIVLPDLTPPVDRGELNELADAINAGGHR